MPEDRDGFLRPEIEVLGAEALVPPANLVRPAPNRFTHRLTEDTPYFYGRRREGAPADGRLAAGTPVVAMVDEDDGCCRVVDGQGLYVEVPAGCLAPLGDG